MSTNWLIHIHHHPLEPQRINRTESYTGRASEATIFVDDKELSWLPHHTYTEENSLPKSAQPPHFHWIGIFVGMIDRNLLILLIFDSQSK